MARKITSSGMEDYEDKLGKVKLSDGPYSRKNLKVPDHEETIPELVAEGMRLIDLDEKQTKKPVDESSKLETKLGIDSPNPYIRARYKLLAKMTEEHRKAIELMEKGDKPKDRRYDNFIKEVTELGDKMSA